MSVAHDHLLFFAAKKKPMLEVNFLLSPMSAMFVKKFHNVVVGNFHTALFFVILS